MIVISRLTCAEYIIKACKMCLLQNFRNGFIMCTRLRFVLPLQMCELPSWNCTPAVLKNHEYGDWEPSREQFCRIVLLLMAFTAATLSLSRVLLASSHWSAVNAPSSEQLSSGFMTTYRLYTSATQRKYGRWSNMIYLLCAHKQPRLALPLQTGSLFEWSCPARVLKNHL